MTLEDARLALNILGILDDTESVQLMARVFEAAGDELTIATDLAEGLARSASEAPDVVLLDVSLGKNAGLALVHHLRAICPAAAIYALTPVHAVEVGTQAVALGSAGLMMLPLSGDELMTAVAEQRARRAEHEARLRLEEEATASRRGMSLVAQVAEVADTRDRAIAARQLSDIFMRATGASPVLIYLLAGERSKQLMCAHATGDIGDAPSFCAEMELLNHARNVGWEVFPLALGAERTGLAVLGNRAKAPGEEEIIRLIAAQAATTFALIGEREHSHRGAMKDPSSSAYTFAYFVDVAGREIDKARRHGRRFALATISVEHGQEGRTGVATVERILGAVRDTDVLARVDEDEFYLLLPETGGTGAHTCRRRVLRQSDTADRRANNPGAPDITMGLATYPHDGTDLSRLLRSAKHRADAMTTSIVRELGLDGMPLPEILDALQWGSVDAKSDASGTPTTIELPAVDLMSLAVAAVSEGIRGGETHVVVTHHPGMSLGVAVRAFLGRDREEVTLKTCDISAAAGCEALEALTVVAEHGSYVLLGRAEGGVVHAIHGSDPLLVDIVLQRLGEASGERLLD